MPDFFVPLSSTASKAGVLEFVPLNSRTMAAGKTADPAVAGAAIASGDCSKPTITLQRQGEIVTGIKIRCGCGEVVELTCVY